MKTPAVTLLTVLLAGPTFAAEELSFTSNIDVAASCNDVWTSLTEFGRLQKLVPHLHGTANVPRASQLGDALFYTIDKADGSKNTGKFIVTSLEPAYRLQVMVQPDEGPWLRVQEFTLYAKPAGDGEKETDKEKEKKTAKGIGAAKRCHVTYEESYNQLALKFQDFDTSGIVKNLREPYMETILRRLKNISEGREPGPSDEAKKLAEVAKNFP